MGRQAALHADIDNGRLFTSEWRYAALPAVSERDAAPAPARRPAELFDSHALPLLSSKTVGTYRGEP